MDSDLREHITEMLGDFDPETAGMQIMAEDVPIHFRDDAGKLCRNALGMPLVDPYRYTFQVIIHVKARNHLYYTYGTNEYLRHQIKLPAKTLRLRHVIDRRALAFITEKTVEQMKADMIWRLDLTELYDYDPRAGTRATFSGRSMNGIPLLEPLKSFPLFDRARRPSAMPTPAMRESAMPEFGQFCRQCGEGFDMVEQVPLWAGYRQGWTHTTCWTA